MNYKLVMLKSSPIVIKDEDNELELKYDWSKFDYFDFKNSPNPIISGIPGLVKLDLSELSGEDCERIGWVNNDWINDTISKINDGIVKKTSKLCLSAGHNKLRTDTNKFILDEEDIRKIILMSRIRNYNTTPRYSINEIIGTISKPKIFEVDLEINDEKCIITKIK